MTPIEIMLVEDFPILRRALHTALATDPRLRVLHAAADGRSLLDAMAMHPPEVVLVDLHLPDGDGIELLERIHRVHRPCKVVVLTACERPAQVVAALHAGASGYLVKRQDAVQIADSIVAVSRGGTAIAPQVASAVADRAIGTGATAPGQLLSSEELRVLRHVVRGDTDRQIAGALFVSPRTVQNTLARVRRKTGVDRRAGLARWAFEHDVV